MNRESAAPTTRRLYLALYDVVDDRRRRRAFAILEAVGVWTQYSAFVCAITPSAMAAAEARLRATLDESMDRLLIVDLGEEQSARGRFRTIGRASAPAALEPFLIF